LGTSLKYIAVTDVSLTTLVISPRLLTENYPRDWASLLSGSEGSKKSNQKFNEAGSSIRSLVQNKFLEFVSTI
jgi:hypothetical protein